jgi:Rha family phage regulatory protein
MSETENGGSKKGKEVAVQLTMFDAMKLLDFSEERLLVSSIDVAERFGKLHKNVLTAIQGIECSDEFRRLNFKPASYNDAQGKPRPVFKLTRDGFSLLVMGFSGTKAMYWKERYIQAFNMMEAEILRRNIEHAEARGRSKEVRVNATDSYKEHGATEWWHYSNNTDAIYRLLFGMKASQLRRKWNLPDKANVRNHLSTEQLHHIIQIENAITLQLEMRRITNPDDQLLVVEHVTRNYKAMVEAPLPRLSSPRN